MASSQIEIVSDSTAQSEHEVAKPAQNTNTVTIDNVFTASRDGDFKKLRKFVEHDGASLSSPNNDGLYALQLAAANNHPKIVQYIIEHGGDVNAVDKYQQKALHFSARIGSIFVADVLLQNGADVEAANDKGQRAVHFAAQNGETSFLDHIVSKYNADLDVPDNDGGRPLHIAAFNNHPEIVQYTIEHGVDVNAVDNDQQTALHYAAEIGSISVADLLLQNGAHIEVADEGGNIAVHFAAHNGKTSFLNHIVSKYNADFDVPNNGGRRPLHWAAFNNHSEIVQYIVEHGADVNAIDNNHNTVLHCAATIGSIAIADMLLQNGAHVEAADVYGDRAVHIAAKKGHTSFLNHIVSKYNADFDVPNNDGVRPLHWAALNNRTESVQYIIEHGADVNSVDNDQHTALHCAARIGSIFFADMLFQNGAQVEAADKDGKRAVHFAALDGHTSFFNHIVSIYNADFDVQDNGGWRPLHWAAFNNHPEIVQCIIEHGADVNSVDLEQRTALHSAAWIGSISVADKLLQNGAHVEAAVVDGKRAVHFAAQNGKTSFLKHIVSKYNAEFDVPNNDGLRPLHLAAFNNHPETVQYIIEHGAEVNAVDNGQHTALHCAARIGSISVADMLLQNGAQVEAADVYGQRAVNIAAQYGQASFLKHIVAKYNADFYALYNGGWSPLHRAVINNHPEIVQYIIEHGGDVNAVDNHQETALYWAALEGSISIADLLLQNGADVDAANENGHKAVHAATQKGQTSFLKHIVAKYNADFDAPDNNGGRPLHLAAINNYPEIVQYIIEHGADVNSVDNDHQTALHWAAVEGSISAADMLLQNGAHVEDADVDGLRTVHLAAQNGETSFLNHIVTKHNADFDVPDNKGMSPLHWASCMGFVDIVKWLLSKDASCKRQDEQGYTPLHWAVIKRKIEVCMVLIDAGTKEDIMVKDNEGNTAIQLTSSYRRDHKAHLISKALQAECKHLQNSNIKGKASKKGTNWPMIIAMQGDSYTGKSIVAVNLAARLRCPIISLDDFLIASEPTDEKDTLISTTFDFIIQIVKRQISLGFSVIVDSPLSQLSHLQKLFALISTENTQNTQLLIIECKPKNEYAYQLRFEETGSSLYASSWYKPVALWPLPKVLKDYTDEDIPYGVSKLVVDNNDYVWPCQLLTVMFDVTSCGYGHVAKFDDYWQFIHTDKKEQFTCPHCIHCKHGGSPDAHYHVLTFYEGIDHCDRLCGVCDNQVSGSHYTCKDCPLALHKSCAELALGEKKHFVPESFPIFLPSEPHFRYAFPIEHPCDKCRKDENKFSYKCKHCLFESHLKSRLVPTVVRHKAHNDFLTLFIYSNGERGTHTHTYMCMACKIPGRFAMYLSKGPEKYHLRCALLPPSVHHSHGGYKHDLEMIINRVEELEDYMCDCCSIKMDPSAWYYYCSECHISLHLECAFVDFDSGGPIREDQFGRTVSITEFIV